MSSNSVIIPECYVDSCLIEVLIIADKNHVNHQKGNGTVVREMKKSFDNSFCVGIIDEDRKDLDYLTEFELVKGTEFLKLWKHRQKHQYMVQIRPVVEKWILNICTKGNIDLTQFRLPTELKPLQKISKSVSSKTDVRFVNLFKMIVKKNSEAAIQLRNWLLYLKEKNYNADINELRNV